MDDNVFSRAAAKMVSPSFGFAILLIGAGLLIASVFAKGEKIYAWDRTQIYSPKISSDPAHEEAFKKALEGVNLGPIDPPQKVDLRNHVLKPGNGKGAK